MSDDGVTVQAAPAPEEEMEEDKVEIEALSTEERSSAVGEDEKSESVVGGEDDGDEEESKSSHQADNDSPKASSSTDAAADEKKNSTVPPSSRRGRAPAVKGLTIPFRTVKKAMKLDPDIPIVQNEAAIMTTLAAELFLKVLAKDSHSIAKKSGRNTIRYEDIAEARANDASMAFLNTLIP